MTAKKRLLKLISALAMVLAAVFIVWKPDDGIYLVAFVLDITLLAAAVKNFLYYFTMARFMVGGQTSLFKAVIMLDFGMFIYNLDDVHPKLIMIYLLALMAFGGIADVMHAMESRKLMTRHWKYECFIGCIKLIICVVSLFFLDSHRILAIIYAAGLLHSALSNVIVAFRRTALVYIN